MALCTRSLVLFLLSFLPAHTLLAQDLKAVPESRCIRIDADSACSLYRPSLIELIANPAPYEGKRVQVIGYLHLEFEGNGIYFHREDLEHGIHTNGFWVEFAPDTRKPGESCVDKYALIEGTFTATERGHMSLWSGTIKDITRCVPWRLSSQGHG